MCVAVVVSLKSEKTCTRVAHGAVLLNEPESGTYHALARLPPIETSLLPQHNLSTNHSEGNLKTTPGRCSNHTLVQAGTDVILPHIVGQHKGAGEGHRGALTPHDLQQARSLVGRDTSTAAAAAGQGGGRCVSEAAVAMSGGRGRLLVWGGGFWNWASRGAHQQRAAVDQAGASAAVACNTLPGGCACPSVPTKLTFPSRSCFLSLSLRPEIVMMPSLSEMLTSSGSKPGASALTVKASSDSTRSCACRAAAGAHQQGSGRGSG